MIVKNSIILYYIIDRLESKDLYRKPRLRKSKTRLESSKFESNSRQWRQENKGKNTSSSADLHALDEARKFVTTVFLNLFP